MILKIIYTLIILSFVIGCSDGKENKVGVVFLGMLMAQLLIELWFYN